jgi:alkyl sulfatase BDS1-like metallo-beta-lactamase superfamily hydrolase
MIVNRNFTGPREQFVLNLENSALTHVAGKQSDKADATLTLSRATLDAVALRRTTFPEAVQAGLVKVEGDVGKLTELLGMLDTFNPMFEVVEPKRSAQP